MSLMLHNKFQVSLDNLERPWLQTNTHNYIINIYIFIISLYITNIK